MVGEFKDDQLQRVYGQLSGTRAGIGGSDSGAFKTYGSAENVSTWDESRGTLDLDSTRTTRSGWETDSNDSNKPVQTPPTESRWA